VHAEHGPAAVIAFQEVTAAVADRFGMAKLKPGRHPPELELIVEKPGRHEAPSLLAQLGRFVLPWRTVEILESMLDSDAYGTTNELYLTHANDQLCRESRVLAHSIEGRWITTGDFLSFLIANIEYARQHPDMQVAKGLAEYLRHLEPVDGSAANIEHQ
jgi:UTP--glucose-1-phosphate uridylyltransferase